MLKSFNMKKILVLFFCQTAFAANDIQFNIELSDGQLNEQVVISIDGQKVCELEAKSVFFGLIKSTDQCTFQPTNTVHRYIISGDLTVEDEKKAYQGHGEGYILNYYAEYEQLKSAQNIDELFAFYDLGIKNINKVLRKDEQISLLNFTGKELQASVKQYIKDKDVVLSTDYMMMITQYGYPQNIDVFIPIHQQQSIADVYLKDYDYPSQYVNQHEGVEKNHAFFHDNDVYYVFHNQTAEFCQEPMIDYTIMTEGDYFPINVKKLTSKEQCGGFFEFLKEQVIEGFIENINASFENDYILPVYKNNTLAAELSYNWVDEDSLEYYFAYNDIFY